MCLICFGKRISNSKSCELEEALDSINLKDIFACPYASLVDKSNGLYILGIADIVLNSILFLLTLYLGWLQYKEDVKSDGDENRFRIWTPLGIVSHPQSI